MRVLELVDGFGVERLREREAPDPEPGPGEVLVRLRAASLNFRDLLMIAGRYDPRQPLPLIPLSDAAGQVERLGDGVDGLALGELVCPVLLPDWVAGEPSRRALRTGLGGRRPGVARTAMVVRAEHVVRAPPHLDARAAATLPCAALTAWSALFTQGHLAPGQRVLVQGTGGVALFALQLARLGGAAVCITSRDDGKLDRALALGAEHGINARREPAWGELARAWSGDGVDHVVEVGGATTLTQSLRAVRPGGTVSVIGVLGGPRAPVDVLPLLMNQVRLQGIFCGHQASFRAMNDAIARARLQPVIDSVFPFGVEGLRAALARLESGQHFGKIVLDLER